MRKPNFFIVGAPRCGTTSLYGYLRQHPEIYVSVHKEPLFFGSDLTPMAGMIHEEQLYLELFAKAGEQPRVGEASVWYLFSTRAAAEIHAYAPAAKIIAMVRNPVEMAYSLHSLYLRSGNEDLRDFEAALAAEPARRAGRDRPSGAYFPEGLVYTEVARHAEKVERYLDVFGRDNVHCVVFDDLVRDTPAVYRSVLEFLGVEPGFAAELDHRRAREVDRMLVLRQLVRTSREVRNRMQFDHLRLHQDAARPPLPAKLAARLRGLFADDVFRLGALLGRDLGAWTRGERLAPAGSAEPPAAPAQDRLRRVFESVQALRQVPHELRAKHDRVETLERKFARWQTMRVPDLDLEQRRHDPRWAAWFAGERARLAGALDRAAVRIEHFGSTAVPGLSSKNIIDVLVGLDAAADRAAVDSALARLGYESYGNSPVDPETVWYWKLESDRAFVVHLGDRRRPWMDDQVDLRDYLSARPEERARYADFKRHLAEEPDKSLLQYSIRKLAMSMELVERARRWRSGALETLALDDQALMGAGADETSGSRDLDREAEQAVLGDPGQPDADRHLLAGPGDPDVMEVDAGADRGLAGVQVGIHELQAAVLAEADHARGREDAAEVRRAHVRGHRAGRLVGEAGTERVDGHGDE